jgi:hypothetical protein
MTEDNIEVEQTEEVLDYKSLFEKTQEDLNKVLAKKDELLTEVKKAKRDKDLATEAMKKEELDKAQKAGEYEKLWQSSETEKKQLQDQLHSFMNEIKNEKITNVAMKLAADLAKGDSDRAELLSIFVKGSLEKLADEKGTLSDDVIMAVKRDMESNKKFASLIGGSNAKGGGAVGGKSSAQIAEKTIDRASFDGMDPFKQMEYIKSGGKLVD